MDLWLKELAPSTELRKWFGHERDKWKEFQTRYGKELHDKTDQIENLQKRSAKGVATLVYGARD